MDSKSREQHPSVDPRQWSAALRRRTTIILGLLAFLEPFASSIIAPALSLIADEFSITSSVERNLVLSAFVLPYAVGALLFAPISESIGRRPVVLSTTIFFVAFTLGCGFAQSSTQLIILRVFAGLAGCAPLAVGAAIIGDMYAPSERGSAMAWYMALQLSGPAIGPIVGGWVAQTIDSWRWSFYICAIAVAVVAVALMIGLPETYAPKLNSQERVPLSHCLRSLKRPFVLLGTQPIIQVLAVFAATIFGIYYLFLTTIASVFRDKYRQSTGISSLHYLAMLLGFIIGVLGSAKAMDRLYAKLTRDGPFPEARIPFLAASATALPVGLLIYGWTAQYQYFWAVPDVGLLVIGVGILMPLASIQHYILDCYSKDGLAASALAAMNVARFLAGFGFPLFADAMFDAIDLGWGTSLLGLVAFVTGCLSGTLWIFGPPLREMSSVVNL